MEAVNEAVKYTLAVIFKRQLSADFREKILKNVVLNYSYFRKSQN